jgi:hypothetical protein
LSSDTWAVGTDWCPTSDSTSRESEQEISNAVLESVHDEDEGICIYLDGLSGHLHGNPETAERDREIRSWLRNNGYEVIEVA